MRRIASAIERSVAGHHRLLLLLLRLAVIVAGRSIGLVVEDRDSNDALAGCSCGHISGHIGRLQFRRQLPLPFVAPILKPNFHLQRKKQNEIDIRSAGKASSIFLFYLSLSETEGSGQTGPFRAGQVALHVKGRLELEYLRAAYNESH